MCPKAHGDADDASAGDQWADLDTQRGEHHKHRHHDDRCEQNILEDRQERVQPRLLRIEDRDVLVADHRVRCFDAQLSFDQSFDDRPAEVGGEGNDHDIDQAAQYERRRRIAVPHGLHVQTPDTCEKVSRRQDENHSDSAIDDSDRHRRDRGPADIFRTWPQNEINPALRHHDCQRQEECGEGEPEVCIKAGDTLQEQDDEISSQ
ncbi:hypothetical protein NKI48_01430 [Mesorhizobium sp. M0644]|uniref:hypothetical protein n=1 Tax=Mesorhizobium sp. M0644 TaxID=2956979 RepID=UPI00333D07A7